VQASRQAFQVQVQWLCRAGWQTAVLNMFRLWGLSHNLQLYSYDSAGVITANLQGNVYQPNFTTTKRVGIGLVYNSNNVQYSIYFTYNNYGVPDPNNTAMTLCHTFTLNYNDYNVSREGNHSVYILGTTKR